MSPTIGQFGWRFKKVFDVGEYEGIIVQVRPNAKDEKIYQCQYDDEDDEDLSMEQLKQQTEMKYMPSIGGFGFLFNEHFTGRVGVVVGSITTGSPILYSVIYDDGDSECRESMTKEDLTMEELLKKSFRVMEEAHYEAFVDPYRGMTPFFSLSFNNNSSNDVEGGRSSGDHETNVNIDKQSPWMQCETVLQGQEECCPSWRLERGEVIDVKNMTSNSNHKKQMHKGTTAMKQQQTEVIMNVDEDSSSIIAVQQLDFTNNNDDNDQDKVRIVQCGCPTIDSWAIQEWDKYQQYLSKQKKKGKKKRKKRKRKMNHSADVVVEEVTDLSCEDDTNVVMAIDDDNDDDDAKKSVASLAESTPILICGQRKLSGGECCACDFNPVSVTKSKQLLIIIIYTHSRHLSTYILSFVWHH